MQTPEQADHFSQEWIAAWNSHDLERILSHYAEDVDFFSPLAARLVGAPGGLVRGRAALGEYFSRGLEVFPELHFEPIGAMAGASSIAVHYRSRGRGEVIEVVDIAPGGLVCRSAVHYATSAGAQSQDQ
jgi:hypothetical protein